MGCGEKARTSTKTLTQQALCSRGRCSHPGSPCLGAQPQGQREGTLPQQGPIFSSAPICPSALSGDRVPPWPQLSGCPFSLPSVLPPISFHPGGPHSGPLTDLLPNKCPWKICFNEHHSGQKVNNLRGNGADFKMLCLCPIELCGRELSDSPMGLGDPLKSPWPQFPHTLKPTQLEVPLGAQEPFFSR